MSKLRLLTIFSIGLLIANIVLVGFMLSKKNSNQGQKRKHNPIELLTRELHLNNAQKEKVSSLVRQHKAYMDSIRTQVEPIKKELRNNIFSPDQSLEKDTLFNVLGLIQADVERKFHQHFIDIKNICEGEQIEQFEIFLEKMPQRHGPNRNRKR